MKPLARLASVVTLAIGLSMTVAVPATQASVISEFGDAGYLVSTAQVLTGTGALDGIYGQFAYVTDVDLYAIYITDPNGFSATTVGGTTLDTQLFLFDSTGAGVSANDDDTYSGPLVLQSSLTSTFVLSSGLYYLGISLWDNDPLALSLSNVYGEMWLDSPTRIERSPDGVSATGTLLNWDFSSSGYCCYPPDYLISLSGAQLVPPAAPVPEPATLLLLGTGLGIAGIRRRLTRRG